MHDHRTPTALARLLPPRPVIFMLGAWIAGLLLFAAARLVFLFHFRLRLDGVPFSDLATAFYLGARFDTVVIAAALVPLVLVLPWVGRRMKTPGAVAIAYLAVVFGLLLLLLLADIRFYDEYDSHLNFNVLDYLSEGRTAWNLVLYHPAFWTTIAAWATILTAFTLFLVLLRRFVWTVPVRRSWINTSVYALLLIAACFLGMRGRLDLAPIDWGVAYFSRDPFVNQLPLNGAYTLGRTLTERDHDPRLIYRDPEDRWPFVDFSVALDTTQAMIGLPHEIWLEPDSSLKRLARQPTAPWGFQPNVVFVLMESFSGRNTGCVGSLRDLTPHFDSLARHGLLFRNFYATGTRTAYGIAGAVCSFPSLPGRAILKRYAASHPFITLSELLHGRGYFNAFLYGGDLVFDNMAGFLKSKDYRLILGEEDLGSDSSFSKWGIPDHILFDRAVRLADTLPRPFQLSILTLSNHTPFDLPDSSVRRYFSNDRMSRIYNAQLYADHAIGRFMATFDSLPVFDSTIFVFTADHALWDLAHYMLDPANTHIPLLIYAPRLLGDSGRVITTFGGQCDLLPTLMGLLGSDYIHESWGRDLLKLPSDDPGFAIFHHAQRLGYLDPDAFFMEILDHHTSFFATDRLYEKDADITATAPALLDHHRTRLHYYLQTAELLALPVEIRQEVSGNR